MNSSCLNKAPGIFTQTADSNEPWMFVAGPVRSLLYRVCCPSPVWEWTVTARLCPAGRGQAAEAAIWVEATVGVEAPSGRSCRCLRDDSSFLLRQLQLHVNSQGRRTAGVVLMVQLLKVKCMRSYLSVWPPLMSLRNYSRDDKNSVYVKSKFQQDSF